MNSGLSPQEPPKQLKSGKSWKILSPVFIRAKSKRTTKRQVGGLRHLGLEILGIIQKISLALVGICVSMAVLCPSFEVASQALRGFGIQMNEHLLQNITHRFANLAKPFRAECHGSELWQEPKLRILICVDCGRSRERKKKRGKRKKGLKRQGYTTDWFEPRLLIISQFDKEGKQIKDLLWNGDINGITDLVKTKLGKKRNALKSALKKLDNYFGKHNRFQYESFRSKGLPTGSGTVESAIRTLFQFD